MRHISKIPDISDVRRTFNESNLNINEMFPGKYVLLRTLRFSTIKGTYGTFKMDVFWVISNPKMSLKIYVI